MSDPARILETAIPTRWHNIVADMPNPPAPPLAPNGQPVTPEQMGAIFPEPLFLGHDFMPPGIHAGGLRYHGDSPLVSQLYHEG